MHSFREHAACLGISGDFSVMGQVLGFFRPTLPPDPSLAVATVSMRDQIAAIEGRHIHINVIRVGFDAIPAADIREADDKIDWAILRMREIYAPARLGVGRVLHWEITQADAGGADDIGSRDEMEELRDDWSVPNDGLDVFIVRTMSTNDFVGNSPRNGACEKDEDDDALFGGPIDRTFDQVARTIAHEVGHYLGLSHNHGEDCPTEARARRRLMAQTRCALSVRNSTRLTSRERLTVRGHCMVRSGC